jgi:hypothetical protein
MERDTIYMKKQGTYHIYLDGTAYCDCYSMAEREREKETVPRRIVPCTTTT